MRLGAWGLFLLYPLAVAHASWIFNIRVFGLMFWIGDMFNTLVPACAAISAFIALALGWAAVEAFIDDRGPMSPGVARLAIVF